MAALQKIVKLTKSQMNSLVSANKVKENYLYLVEDDSSGALTSIPAASKTTLGGVKVWLEGTTLYISTN